MARMDPLLARMIPVRPWIALALFLIGVLITVAAFWLHNLWLALAGAPFLGGAIGFLLLPLPYPR
jgi:phosphotransferase system  glucose/maltose/N-acetylglucosamine-specific IIC component